MENPVKEFFESIADNWNNEGNDYEIINYLFNLINIKENEAVLDLGCGKGIITPIIYKYSKKKVIGIDLSEKMIEGAKLKNPDLDKYEYLVGDYINYDFNQKFDKIIIFNAFPHFLDKESLVNKTYNDLNENGYLIIMHDLGKARLNKHHTEHANQISSGLNTPEEEYLYFKDKFKLEKSIDEENKYLMILRKI